VCVNIIASHSPESFPPMPQRPLCLRGGEPNGRPVWCYENVKDTDLNCGDNDCGSNNFWLWWSPCEDCGGTAWRLYNKRDDDESWYKMLSKETSFPPSGEDVEWLLWNAYGDQGQWENTTLSIQSCDDEQQQQQQSTNFTISTECYDEIEAESATEKALFLVGVLLLVIPAFLGLCIWKAAVSDSTSSNYHTYYTPSYGGGGGDGGGGGGC